VWTRRIAGVGHCRLDPALVLVLSICLMVCLVHLCDFRDTGKLDPEFEIQSKTRERGWSQLSHAILGRMQFGIRQRVDWIDCGALRLRLLGVTEY
jgi:hypothetical protein